MADNSFTDLFGNLLERKRKPDGSTFTYKEIEEGTAKAVSAEYLRKLHKGEAGNPSYKVIDALSYFFGVSPTVFFSEKTTRDPIFQQILTGLRGRLDWHTFQSCVTDLFREEIPGLTSIDEPSGDKGMDGAFSDGKDSFCPVIVTTRKDYLNNISDNLKSYTKAGLNGRSTIVITSRELSQADKLKVKEKVEGFGFNLFFPPFDQLAVAQRLVGSPKWCQELLNLTGAPRALSTIPEKQTHYLDIPTIGREDEAKALSSQNSDQLLVAQPGTGKTFLLRKIAIDAGGLFVVSDDVTQIVNDIRELKPELLLIDDVQFKIPLLRRLLQIRSEHKGDFLVIASCWPNSESEILQILELPENQVIRLKRISQNHMVEIVKEMGFRGTNHDLQYIIGQAQGRPGLAAVLVFAFAQQDWESLKSGNALVNAALNFIDPDKKEIYRNILACFSIGGISGMEIEKVAQHLGIGLAEIHSILADLATGGVIFSQDNVVTVQPAALRAVLVRDSFFSPPKIPFEPLVENISDHEAYTQTLIVSRAYGAPVPSRILEDSISRCFSIVSWQLFAKLGTNESNWVLENNLDMVLEIANTMLEILPEKTIKFLLGKGIGDTRPIHSHPDHPLKKLSDWIGTGKPGTRHPLARREILLNCAIGWLEEGGDTQIGARALCLVFSPVFESFEISPGSGDTVHIHYGPLTINEMKKLRDLWPKAKRKLEKLELTDFEPIQSMVSDWASPYRVSGLITDDQIEIMKSFTKVLLEDVLKLSGGGEGLSLWAFQTSRRIGLNLSFAVDEEFALIYGEPELEPEWDKDEFKTAQEVAITKIGKLAKLWSKQKPEDVGAWITSRNAEAQRVGLQNHYRMHLAIRELAANVSSSLEWILEFKRLGLSQDYLFPFLANWAKDDLDEFLSFSEKNSEDEELTRTINSIVLSLDNVSNSQLEKIVARLENQEDLVEGTALVGGISLKVSTRLLESGNPRIAGSAAIEIWNKTRQPPEDPDLRSKFEKAIVELDIESLDNGHVRFELQQILVSDSGLAFKWIESFMNSTKAHHYWVDELVTKVGSAVDHEGRKVLIDLLPNAYYSIGLSTTLVGDEVNIYKGLLDRDLDDQIHLAPIAREPSGNWKEMTKFALKRGYSHEDVAMGIIYHHTGIVDSSANSWDNKIRVFDELLKESDKDLQKIGAVGKQYCAQALEEARLRDYNRSIYGR